MKNKRSALFHGRHFQDEIIVLCLRWYPRYSLTYRDLEEMMAERGLSLDHSTIARWALRYAPILRETTFDFPIRMMPMWNWRPGPS